MSLITCQSEAATPFHDGIDAAVCSPNPAADIGETEAVEFLMPTQVNVGKKLIPDFCGHGRFRGGLGHVNVIASVIFAGMSATAVADVASLDRDEIVHVLMERERLGSTGIGGGIGIPHGKLKTLETLVLGFGLSRTGVDFESMDGKPTHIFFLLLTPENSTGLHLKVLARISRILKNELLKERLMTAADADEICAIIREEDEEF